MNRKSDISIAILEDHYETRNYLEGIIAREEGFALAFSAASLKEAQALSDASDAELYLVDLQLPDGHGADFIKMLRSRNPDSVALVLTSLADRPSVELAFASGASGYLLKDTPPDQIVRDMRAVTEGGVPISPQAARHLIARFGPPVVAKTTLGLTERETDVLTAFAKGLSYADTGEALVISVHTVRHHVREIYRKLSVNSRNEAIFEAVQMGLIRL